MRNKFNFKIFLFISFLLLSIGGKAQHYFKIAVDAGTYFKHKIERFPNGDILIGDSSLESLSTGEEQGEIVLSRLDNCGNVVWSNAYIYEDGYLEFKDFKINAADEIFVYGSYYKDLEERVFLAKFDGISGTNLGFRLFHPGTVDHFSYNLDLKDGQLMLYGLRFDFNTLKLGFIAIFNESLTFLWGKTFSPFESIGAAIISEDGGFVGRAGEFLIKLNAAGEEEWATALAVGSDLGPVNGPFEVPGGFILESNRNDLSFFYKIDHSGQLVWKSEQFSSTNFGAAISLRFDGTLLCTYNCPDGLNTRICQLILSPYGTLHGQQRLIMDKTFNTGSLYQSLDENNTLTIAGNAHPNNTVSADIKDFLFQLSLGNSEDECWYWESFDEKFVNNLDLDFSYYNFEPLAFDMVQEENTTLDATTLLLPFVENCSEIFSTDLLFRDTLLPCGEDWVVSLPAPDFIWLDNTSDNPRTISEPGTYKARKLSCSDPVVVEYTLTKSNCGCAVFLPNVFSPNFDGTNDKLEFFSDCTIDKMEMTIFDRWGEMLFKSKMPDHFWDGTFHQKDMPSGVYIAFIKYEFTDLDGTTQQAALVQDVTLVR